MPLSDASFSPLSREGAGGTRCPQRTWMCVFWCVCVGGGVSGGKRALKSVLVGGGRPRSFFLSFSTQTGCECRIPPVLHIRNVHMASAGKQHTPPLCARHNGTSSLCLVPFCSIKEPDVSRCQHHNQTFCVSVLL